ncbi:hypothetical protein PFICI_06578 [Pestalotiopsis fici W106-1]|uniref:Azaphilone pigments biosynthesis cluster protein L N-terminal domain-containing protein n=1 Tax=Pestalotiopsis fici (strain W106-1 / CGMCC3.15140) TaxID=1229662 RepID=W3X8R6_PESFW|nr:uncharacterized protein PFICI_06578 [Pestalotiopsis fici W106-1]ETS81576.1 hypothetical protein PFICI_06578 [Pestalotiopsis fici W106-1]
MADPISLVGTAVGVASLAIQLFSGFTSYIDKLKCRKEDLDAVNRKLSDFRASIDAIKSTEKRRRDNHSTPQPALDQCLQTCEAELLALKAFWEKCSDEGANAPNLRHRVKTKAKELSFPFHREDLARLEARLDQATNTMTLALQAVHIDEAVTTSESLKVVLKNTNTTSGDMRMIRQHNHDILQGIGQLTISFDKASSKDEEAAKCMEERIAAMQQLMEAGNANIQWMMERMRRVDDNQMVSSDSTVGLMDSIHPCSFTDTYTKSSGAVGHNPAPAQVLTVGSLRQGQRGQPSPLSPPLHRNLFCTCAQIRRRQLRWNPLSTWSFGVKYTSTHHHPSCPMAQVAVWRPADRHQVEVKIAARLRSWMLDFALAGVLGNTYLSIYPSLNCTRTVGIDSPSYKILAIIEHSIYSFPDDLSHVLTRIIDHALQKLKKLYEERRASPLDMDVNGVTFVELFASVLGLVAASDHYVSLFLDFLTCLKSWGVELRQEFGSSNQLILCLLRLEKNNVTSKAGVTSRQWIKRLSDIGLDLDATFESAWTRANWDATAAYPVQLWHASNPTEYASSATQVAIMNQDYDLLQVTLLENPKDLEKHFTLGDVGTLAMAIFWPKGLQLLVRTILENDMLDTQLFELGQAYRMTSIQHLPSEQIASYAWSAGYILDTEANAISSMLKNCNIYVPGILRVSSDWKSVFRTMMNGIVTVKLLDLIWEAGFQHPDTYDMFKSPDLSNKDLFIYDWYIQHGINPRQTHWIHKGNFSVSHLCAAVVGEKLSWNYKRSLSDAESFANIVGQNQHHDTCRCHCSPSGCSPFKVYLHAYISTSFTERRRSAKRQAERWQMSTALSNKSSDFLECQLQAIRLATFDELGLAHTCCTRLWDKEGELFAPEEEEMMELQKEDQALLQVLEDLMDEFIIEFPRSGCGLREFFEGYWIQRIRENLEQLNADTLTEQHLKEAEDMGVIWDSGSVAGGNSDMEYYSSDDDWTPERRPPEEQTFEYWERMIDDI